MKFILALVFVGLAFGDDNDCHKQLVAVHDCVAKKHDQNKAADEKKMEQAKTDVAKCFTQAGCAAPDYSGKSGPGGQIAKQWESQPENVKECIKKDFKTAALAKLNECLSSKGVKQIQVSEMDDHDVFGDRNVADGENMAKSMIAIMMAMKKCKAADQVMTCVDPIKNRIKGEMCKRVNDCKTEVKVTDACKKRGQEIKDAVCKCKVDKMKEAKAKIEELQKTGGDVSADDIQGLHGEEGMGGGPGGAGGGPGGFDIDKIEKCYTDNGEKPPAILGLIKTMGGGGNGGQGGQGGGLLALFKQSKPKVTQAQLKQMHDGLEAKIRNPECGC